MSSTSSRVAEFQVTGPQLISAIKDLVHQSTIRRISIRNAAGVTLLEIPLVVGLAGAAFVPVWAAIGALAALVAHCTLAVERVEGTEPTASGSVKRSTKSKARTKKRPSGTA